MCVKFPVVGHCDVTSRQFHGGSDAVGVASLSWVLTVYECERLYVHVFV